MATDLVGSVGELTGIGQGGGTHSGFPVALIILLIFLFSILAGFLTYYFVMKKKYKYKIVIFEKVDGRPKNTRKDVARIVKVGQGGDEVLELKKNKKLVPMPTLQTGEKTFWYYISEDGEWMNFTPGDFDENRREMGATFLDKEMRYARTSLQHMAKERYNKPGFFEKYGGMIAYTVLILVTAIGFYLLLGKMLDISHAVAGAVDSAKQVLDASKQVIGNLDVVKQGGAGYVAAA